MNFDWSSYLSYTFIIANVTLTKRPTMPLPLNNKTVCMRHLLMTLYGIFILTTVE